MKILKKVRNEAEVFICECGCVYEGFKEELHEQKVTDPFSGTEITAFCLKCQACKEKNYL